LQAEWLPALLAGCREPGRLAIRVLGQTASNDAALIDFTVRRGGRAGINLLELLEPEERLARWMQAMLAAPGRVYAHQTVDPAWAAEAKLDFNRELLERLHCLPMLDDDPERLVAALVPSGEWLEGLDSGTLGAIQRLVVGTRLLFGDRESFQLIPPGVLSSMPQLEELHCEAIDVRMAAELATLTQLRVLRVGEIGEQRAWIALAAAVGGMKGLEVLILEEVPDPGLVQRLARLNRFARLVVLVETPPPDADVEALQAALPGVQVEIVTPAEAISLEPAVLKNHRTRMRSEILEWLKSEDAADDKSATVTGDD
jgi:hypothetical protein